MPKSFAIIFFAKTHKRFFWRKYAFPLLLLTVYVGTIGGIFSVARVGGGNETPLAVSLAGKFG